MDMNDILNSVSQDFFGSTDDQYKDLLTGGTLKDLEAQLDKLREGSGAGKDGASPKIPDGIKDAMDQLSKLDEIVLNNAGIDPSAYKPEIGSDPYAAEEPGSYSSGAGAAASSQAAASATANEVQEPDPDEPTGMEELNELIGLEGIKHDVRELVSFMKVQKLRVEKGGKSVPVSLHLVFTGNPGTGKTTIARILAKLYKEIGVLSKGQLVEVDRSGLVAGYVGQTAVKTQQKIQQALGGILFIDEAYALAKEGNDYGQEAIDTILKAMEDHRDDFIVIVAGYTELMETFINSNPGLKSRFNKFIEFPDYTEEELYEIFMLRCRKYSYTLTEEADALLKKIMHDKVAHKGPNFANAREARNLFEAAVTNQATRIADLEVIPDDILSVLEASDLAEFAIE
ncbi:MAG: AAA family ATPase [Lachnospiraceae bacterium]|nr:AAA family ATPase [Lachnospiraceae bacterium]